MMITGASRVYDPDRVSRQLRDKKRRLVWNMPRPVRHVEHFISAGTKRLFENGELEKQQAIRMVPIYAGKSARDLTYERSQAKRSLRLKRKEVEND